MPGTLMNKLNNSFLNFLVYDYLPEQANKDCKKTLICNKPSKMEKCTYCRTRSNIISYLKNDDYLYPVGDYVLQLIASDKELCDLYRNFVQRNKHQISTSLKLYQDNDCIRLFIKDYEYSTFIHDEGKRVTKGSRVKTEELLNTLSKKDIIKYLIDKVYYFNKAMY